MSRGFVKEDDQEEVPFISPRADLPDGSPNYVTAAGMQELLDERKDLNEEREGLQIETEKDRRIAQNIIDLKLKQLNERISSARVVETTEEPLETVRFGCVVTVKMDLTDKPQKFRIVGVDEADIKKGKIAFTSPLAKQLLHQEKGSTVNLKLPAGDRSIQILSIEP
ncbi:GreA/GreB family elongation factor [Zeaxanthinibacter sp. PT1]|uniref:GreA/GreB family elongation factor n=1 Tax=Zeaxanthinibacter TaxID=561554 RepID=UPI002349694A|nr:GreA/GreB family elongation factor [Zeaxanthinibacter sp. PT1]MDC6351486.1 GreA/GreB family elongation factor [Zeaxanthinibacter sp. PT1]